jgi:hypothetical protein
MYIFLFIFFIILRTMNKTCTIRYNKLINKCGPNGLICFNNTCHKIIRKLSTEKNSFGNIFVLNDPNKSIVKINKKEKNNDKFKIEKLIQKYVSQYELCPKVLQYYTDDKGFHYIIMENLLEQGYETWHKTFNRKLVPNKAILALFAAIKKLHSIGISHNDLHSNNIFYNKNTGKVKFIDFGLSEIHESEKIAIINEKWDQIYSLTKYKGQWSIIQNKLIIYKNIIIGSKMMLYEYYGGSVHLIDKFINKIKDYFDNNKLILMNILNVYNKYRKIKNKNEMIAFIKNNYDIIDFLKMCNKVFGINDLAQLIIYQNI